MTVNLLDFDAGGLARFLAVQGETSDRANMRARQLIQWIHQRGVTDFDGMTDVAKSLRARLAEVAAAAPPQPLRQTVSDDGTRKWLLDVGGANAVETVFIPEDGRGTLCVSSQAGCALECSFCATGKQGFSRNLSAAEIIGQLWHAKQALGDFGAGDSQQRIISNVVMMGMGEPLANLDNLIVALKLMLDDHAYGLSRRRVTVSTSGLVPAIDRLRDACPVALAVSLHAPDDALRDELVPINRKYPLTELMAACRRYLERSPRDFITFEYVMIDGVNDGDAQARALLALTREVPCKFNLIPFNSFPGSAYRRSSNNRIRAFQERLMAAQVVATVRKTRGDDVDAACGQLAGQVRDRTRRGQRLVQMAQVHS